MMEFLPLSAGTEPFAFSLLWELLLEQQQFTPDSLESLNLASSLICNQTDVKNNSHTFIKVFSYRLQKNRSVIM